MALYQQRANGRTRMTANNMLERGLAASLPVSTFGFLSPTRFETSGQGWYSTYGGDFNGDGTPDAMTLVDTSDSFYTDVVVFLSKGDGTFETKRTRMPTGISWYEIVTADATGDNKPDVIFADSETMTILPGNGDGTFGTAISISFAASEGPVNGVTVIDATKDSKPDIVGMNPSLNLVVLPGNGDGTFGAPIVKTVPAVVNRLYAAAVADFNKDGNVDVAAFINNGEQYVLRIALADASGDYSTYSEFTDLPQTWHLAIGDVTKDGYPEILATTPFGPLFTFVNDGHGLFSQPTTAFAGYFSAGAAIGDMNGDGNPDAVVANEDGGDITVLLGDGTGSFAGATTGFAVGGYPWGAPVVGDFDKDGKLDVFYSNEELGVFFLKGYGDGRLHAGVNYYAGVDGLGGYPEAHTIATGDFNKDGSPDVLLGMVDRRPMGAALYLNNGDGTLTAPTLFAGELEYVAVGDFNGDGSDDWVGASQYNQDVEVFINDQHGLFAAPIVLSTDGYAPSRIVVGNFSGGTKPDIAVRMDDSVRVFVNDGTGAFPTHVDTATTAGCEMASGDLNADSKLDLVVSNCDDSTDNQVLYGNGDGSFTAGPTITLPATYGLVVADLDGDSYKDIVFASDTESALAKLAIIEPGTSNTMGVYVAYGKSDGSFESLEYVKATLVSEDWDDSWPEEVRVVDFDGDNNNDLLVTNSEFGTVALIYGRGGRVFANPVEYPVGSWVYGLALADINGDGAVDAITTGGYAPVATVLLNNSGTVITATPEHNPVLYGATNTLAVLVKASLAEETAVPTGKITATVDSANPVEQALEAGATTFDYSTIGAGTHTVEVNYSGDANFKPSTASLTLQVNKAATNTSIESSPNPASGGTTVTFTATVASTTSGTPSGSVAFKEGSTTLGTGTLAEGTATFTTNALASGTHSITAVYAGDSNFLTSTSTAVDQVISGGTTTNTALTSSKNPANINRPVTFTATVTATTGTPAGNVVFQDGANTLATVALNASGVATYTVNTLALGTHSITAAYQGNGSYLASTSTAVSQVIENNPADYTLTASPSSLRLVRGQSGSVTITLTPRNEYDGAVNLSCGNLPVGVSCLYVPSSLHPTSSSPVTAVLTIGTSSRLQGAGSKTHLSAMLVSFGGLAFGAVLIGTCRRRRILLVLGAVLLVASFIAMTGCAGTPSTSASITPLGQQTVTVTAVGTAGTYSGSTAQHELAIQIEVVE